MPYGNSPVVNLTGCAGASGQETLTCTTNPITAGVTVGMGAYGPGIASTTPDSVSSVTATTVVLSANTSAAVTAAQTESFSGTEGIGNAIDATPTTTVTSAANFADYGVVAGLEVYGPGIAAQTTVASVSGTSMVLSQVPTAPLSGATLYFNAPDVNNVMTQVTGGASNVNTASLTVVSQPPAADGYVTTSTSSTTGIVNMYQALNPVDNSFTATLAYCAPGFTYPSAGNCTTFTEHYGISQSQDMGEQIVEIIETENIYEGADLAHFGPTTAAQGQTVTLTEAPPGGAVPTTNSGATVNYIDGDTYIMPIPSGLTYVPGSAKLIGGDAQTSTAGVTTATYCTAVGTGCTACNFASAGCPSKAPSGNASYPTTYPYLEEQYGTTTADEAKGGALHQLPAIQAQFVVTGAPGSVQNQLNTEYLVQTNVTDILNINVAFDGYPTSGSNGNVVPPVAAPIPLASLTVLPSVTATSTANGNDDGTDTGGQTVQIAGTGFTNAGGEQVYFGANPATSFTVNSNTSITAVAPASTTGDGPVDVTVKNGGQTSAINQPADQFTYIPPSAPDYPLNVAHGVRQRAGRGELDPRVQRRVADAVVHGDRDRRVLAFQRPQQRWPGTRDVHLHGDGDRRSHRLVHRSRPDQWGPVHLPGDGDQRCRYERRLPGDFSPRHRRPPDAHRRRGDRCAERAGARELDRPDQHGRRPAALGHGDGDGRDQPRQPYQRLDLHLLRAGQPQLQRECSDGPVHRHWAEQR